MSNFRTNGCLADLVMFLIFYDFCKTVIIHPVCTVSSCSSFNSDSSHDILNLADVADVLIANSSSHRVLSVMHLGVLKFYESLLFLLIGQYPVFYPMCLFFCNINVQLSYQSFGWPGDLGMSAYPFFAILQAGYRLSWSLHNCLLILIHFMTSWISQMLQMSSLRILFRRVLPVMHLKVLNLYQVFFFFTFL